LLHGAAVPLHKLLVGIDAAQLERLAQPMLKNGYGQYLMKLISDKAF